MKEPPTGRAIVGWIVSMILLLVLLLAVHFSRAWGHDAMRPDLGEWFSGLKSIGGHPCCDGPKKDALHLRDVDWETKDGHYRVRIPVDHERFELAMKGETVDTIWADVPDESVVTDPNRDGSTLVWPIYGWRGPYIQCFMPGSMT